MNYATTESSVRIIYFKDSTHLKQVCSKKYAVISHLFHRAVVYCEATQTAVLIKERLSRLKYCLIKLILIMMLDLKTRYGQ